ncbi:MAG: hypothetical protein AABN34_15960 [Acidobacteriota bacterium]
MNSLKYVALDVDSANIVAGVYDSKGKSMMECFVKTNSTAVRQFFKLLAGTVHVAFDVKKLATLLRLGELHSVYQGGQAIEGLKQLVHGYQTLVEDTTRAMNRLRAVFRSRGIKCNSTVYNHDQRQQWTEKLDIFYLRNCLSNE